MFNGVGLTVQLLEDWGQTKICASE